MKNVCTVLFILLLFAAKPAHAKTLQIGNKAIEYSLSDNYVELKKENSATEAYFLQQIIAATEALKDASFLAAFTSKEDYERMIRLGDGYGYFIVSHFNFLAELHCTKEDFLALKNQVKLEQANENMKESLKKASDKLKNFQQESLGQTYDIIHEGKPVELRDEDAVYSFLLVTNHEANNFSFKQLTIVTFLHVNGKVISIVYSHNIQDKSEIDALIPQHTVFLNSLTFTQEAEPELQRPSTKASDGVAKVMPIVLMIVSGVTGAILVIAALMYYLRKRRN